MWHDRSAIGFWAGLAGSGLILVLVVLMLGAPLDMATDRVEQTNEVGLKPHRPLARGVVVRQKILLSPEEVSGTGAGGPVCVSAKFATYARENKAIIRVTLGDGQDRWSRWQFNAAELEDNAYRTFCPRTLSLGHESTLTIESLSGKADEAPTIWLTKDVSLGALEGDAGDYGLQIRLERRVTNSPAQFLSAGNGAYALYLLIFWLMALMCFPLLSSRCRQP